MEARLSTSCETPIQSGPGFHEALQILTMRGTLRLMYPRVVCPTVNHTVVKNAAASSMTRRRTLKANGPALDALGNKGTTGGHGYTCKVVPCSPINADEKDPEFRPTRL